MRYLVPDSILGFLLYAAYSFSFNAFLFLPCFCVLSLFEAYPAYSLPIPGLFLHYFLCTLAF
jgi:hypothetical protein